MVKTLKMILNTNIIEGDQEPLFGDITGFAEKCEEQGVDHSLDIAAVSPFVSFSPPRKKIG